MNIDPLSPEAKRLEQVMRKQESLAYLFAQYRKGRSHRSMRKWMRREKAALDAEANSIRLAHS